MSKISKVIYGGTTLIDLTSDTVDAAHLLTGYSAHGRDGELVTGACDYDADTSDANATAGEILAGPVGSPITAYVNGVKITGTMPNNGGNDVDVTDLTGTLIPAGYYDGSGRAQLSAAQVALVVPGNIKAGVTLLGVLGTYSGEAINAQSKAVNATRTTLTVLPDAGYDYLSSVTVTIPYVETSNAAGGITATIA